jgi:hypothetical protein
MSHVPPVGPGLRVLLLLLALWGARPARAQAPVGTVQGVAVRDEDAAPIPFALVRLLRADSTPGDGPAGARQAIANANGRFALGDVPPGAYRLQLARIGYQPVLSPVLHVAAGQTLRHELRGAARAVELAGVTVRGDGGCLTLARLADDPRLATLWGEARKGIETRLAFERQYQFSRVQRQNGVVKLRLFSRRVRRADSTRSEPDSVDVRRARRVARFDAEGFGDKLGRIEFPNEVLLLHEGYMRSQCLEYAEASADSAGRAGGDAPDGTVGLRFRPASLHRNRLEGAGTLWLDRRTFLTRRLDMRWTWNGAEHASGHLHYADVPLAGGVLRLPVRGDATVRPVGVLLTTMLRGGSVVADLDYRNVTPVAAAR